MAAEVVVIVADNATMCFFLLQKLLRNMQHITSTHAPLSPTAHLAGESRVAAFAENPDMAATLSVGRVASGMYAAE